MHVNSGDVLIVWSQRLPVTIWLFLIDDQTQIVLRVIHVQPNESQKGINELVLIEYLIISFK